NETVLSLVSLPNFTSIVHTLSQIHSIYIYCFDDNLQFLKSWSESYPKVQAVFSTEERLLFKLAIDMSLYFTKIGDDHNRTGNTLSADKNYENSQNIIAKMIQYLSK
ncbi:unnamed protein product, partial [Didymodactylos carnosus]